MRCEDFPCCGHTPLDPCERQPYDEPGYYDTSVPGQEHRLCNHANGDCDVPEPEPDPCPKCGDDCEQRPVDCCDCLRWDCEVAQDDEVRVCAVLPGGSEPCEHHAFFDPLFCLDEDPDADGCTGVVELRYPLSPTGKWFPRCEKHWAMRLEIQEGINARYPTHAPSDWSPLDAGESWDDDY